MARVFKQRTTVYRLDGRRVKAGTEGAEKVVTQSKKWYVEYRDADGKAIRVPGYTDKKATEQLAARLERDGAAGRGGYRPPRRPPQAAPRRHRANYRRALEAKGNTGDYIDLTLARLEAACDGCGFRTAADFSASALAEWLAGERKRGQSVQTSNYYAAAMKGFAGWLVKDGRAADNPFAHLSRLNAKVDVRRARRALADDEVRRLVEAARGAKSFRGLSGEDRAVLYLVALGSGLRANELASLTPESFALDAAPPAVTVKAGYSKHRRDDVQPIRPDLAELLRPWLATKPAGRPVWKGSWHQKRSAMMIRRDLEAARAAWLGEKGIDAAEKARRASSDFLVYLDAEERSGLPRPPAHVHLEPREIGRPSEDGADAGASLDDHADDGPLLPRRAGGIGRGSAVCPA